MKIIVCVLNKNDGRNLNINKYKLKKIAKKYTTVLVDSNSKDNSHIVAKEIGIKIFNFKLMSRGEAISKCINIFRKKYDFIIFTSSDGEEDFYDIPKFENYFKKGADLVIASRIMPGGFFKSDSEKKWLHRKIYLKFITQLINKLFNGQIYDCWNGFRGFKLKIFNDKRLKIKEKNYLVEAETTINMLKNNYKIAEFPTIELPRKFGKSSNPILHSGIGHLILIFKKYFFI